MSNKIYDGETKGEIIPLRNALDSNDPSARKNAAKRVISLMRAGENVHILFSSMLRCVKTSDLELKKLVYLYLVNYSSQEPEQAIMAVNTFIQDSQDNNPLVRALAVRTMCRIRLESVAEYMVAPLKKCLKDDSPYVRKTAVLGVAKLYDIIPETVENSGIFDTLLECLHDENPMVVSNTSVAIMEINEKRAKPIFELNSETIAPLLSASASCSEWCQIILYDAIAKYKPESKEEADSLIERLTPYLKHKNSSVVMSAFKCIYSLMDYSSKQPNELFGQIIPPFLTLATSAEPEIQYTVLRTISLFVRKYPKSLSKDIRFFFCKYNDPSYVKMEKLDIIVTICTPLNAQLVLDELNEYCNEIDVAFVRKSIRCIGQLAIKIEASARRCVDILVSLISGKAEYAVEESIIIVCDILRKFPGAFESIISKVCCSLERLKEPRSKAAGIWILGEYCQIIENVDVLLDPFLDNFHDEPPNVQLQLLSALVKVYLNNPTESQDQLQFILNEATKDKNAPDVVNHALIYWRLLSTNQEIAKNVVLFGKETILHSGDKFDDEVLTELLHNMGTVSGVLHVVPSDFVKRIKFIPGIEEQLDTDENNYRNWNKLRLNNDSFIDIFSDYDENNMYLRIVNKSNTNINGFAFAINVNSVGLYMKENPVFPESLECGDLIEVVIPIGFDQSKRVKNNSDELQMALRTNLGDVFAIDKIPQQIKKSNEQKADFVDDLLLI